MHACIRIQWEYNQNHPQSGVQPNTPGYYFIL